MDTNGFNETICVAAITLVGDGLRYRLAAWQTCYAASCYRCPRSVPAELVFGRNPEQGGLYVNTSAGRRLRPNTYVRIRKHYLSR